MIECISKDIAIKGENVSKAYKLYKAPVDRLKESLHPFRKKYHDDFFALDGISFEIKKGESLGIIGKNGSGKSTLLKILSGVLTPTSGNVTVNGKISALLELGAGFNPELSGMENVYFNGMLMGYSKEEIDWRLDGILSFADIKEFIHQPVKTYSSGMFVRLAFAVAVNVEPDILIVDEALSVGDVFFQQKCYAKIREKIDSGITCLFVSHDLKAVRNICERCLLLHNGKLAFDGSPEEAVSRYLVSARSTTTKPIEKEAPGERASASEGLSVQQKEIVRHSILPAKNTSRHGAGGVEIIAARVLDASNLDTLFVTALEAINIHILLRANIQAGKPNVGIHLYDRLGNLVFASSSTRLGIDLPGFSPKDTTVVTFKLSMNVQPGEYTFSLGVAELTGDDTGSYILHDRWENLGPLTVAADLGRPLPFDGMAQLPMSVSLLADDQAQASEMA